MGVQVWTDFWLARAQSLQAEGFSYSGIGQVLKREGFTGSVSAFNIKYVLAFDEASEHERVPAPFQYEAFLASHAQAGRFADHPLACAATDAVRARLTCAGARLAPVLRRELLDRRPWPLAHYPSSAPARGLP